MKGVIRALFFTFLASSALAFYDRQQIANARRRLNTLTTSPEDPQNGFQSMVVPESIYEVSSPVDYAHQGEASHASSAGMITMSPNEHDANYIKIAADLKAYEDAYADCINHLSDNDFSDETVDNCVGINFNFVYDDLDYEKSKLLARADSAIRNLMIQDCYQAAGVDLVQSNACDLLEQDTINLLWNELNFTALVDYHRNKYLFEHSFMNETLFNEIVHQFGFIGNELSSLLVELYDHRTLTVTHLEDLISQRTDEIMQRYQSYSYNDNNASGNSYGAGDYYDDDWRKNRNLQGNQRPNQTQKGSNWSAPKSRFLALNAKNIKLTADKAAEREASKKEVKKAQVGKILVDKPSESGKARR